MRQFSVLAVSALLLAACGGSGDNGGSASSVGVGEVARGLQPGQMEVSLSGQVVHVDSVSIEREPVEIFPRHYSAARERNDGTGGRTEVRTNNADGPYRIQFWFGLQRGDESPDMGRIYIQLPPDVQAGRTYVLRDSLRASQGEAYGGLVGPGHAWQLTRGLDGELHVVEVGDTISLAFEFRNNAEPGSDNYFEASGRAYRVPIRPRAEGLFTMTVDGERSEHVEGLMRQDQATRFVALAPQFSMSWEASPAPGEYRIERRRGPGVVGVGLTDIREESVEGRVRLESDGRYYTAHFSFTATGEKTVEAEGRLEFLPVSEQ
jgi:hypothetical protein